MQMISKISNQKISLFLIKTENKKYEVIQKGENYIQTNICETLIEALELFNEKSLLFI